jgi:phosphoglucomutase
VLDRLGDLYRTYGVWVSTQVSIRREGAAGIEEIAAAMDALRSDPPTEIGGYPIVGVRDFLVDVESRPRYLGATNLIEFDLGESGRVLARPSGTEPKLKVYVDLSGPFPESGDWIGAERQLTETAKLVAQDLGTWLAEAM